MNEYTLPENSPDSGVGLSDDSQSPLHRARPDQDHVENLEFFANDLDRALQSSFPASKDSYPYTAVHVLLLRWSDDDLSVQSEINGLKIVFERYFGFEVQEWQIPSKGGHRALQAKIYGFQIAHQIESELLIVYYGGHGEADRRGRSVWRANRRPDSAYLTWSDVQPLLQHAIPHVLIILDCCYAANAARDTTEGTTKELLAACARENLTSGVGPRSFTSALIEELQTFGRDQFTVVMLHSRLVNIQWRLKFTPFYACLSEHGGHSITLAPLPVGGVFSGGKSLKVEESTSTYDPMDTSTPDELSSLVYAQTPSQSSRISTCSNTETRVLLAVSVTEEADPNVDQWIRWLTTQVPWDVTQVRVQVESIYKSHSTVVIVSVPTFAWDRFPANDAYKFICFIKSENILPGSSSRKPASANASNGASIQTPPTSESVPTDKMSLPNSSKNLRPRLSPSIVDDFRSRVFRAYDQIAGTSQGTGALPHLIGTSSDGPTMPRVTKTGCVTQNRRSSNKNVKSATSRISPKLSTLTDSASLSLWSPEDDSVLVNFLGDVRAEGFDWASMTNSLFPKKTPIEVRKRHERLSKTPRAARIPEVRPVTDKTILSPTSQSFIGVSPDATASKPGSSWSTKPILIPDTPERHEFMPWAPEDDGILRRAHQQGLNSGPITDRYFSTKLAKARRKRRERTSRERNTARNWDNAKLEILAQLYMEFREQMWKILASKMKDENWEVVERKCMAIGLRTIQDHAHTAIRKSRDSAIEDHDDDKINNGLDDSGIGHELDSTYGTGPSVDSSLGLDPNFENVPGSKADQQGEEHLYPYTGASTAPFTMEDSHPDLTQDH